MAMQIKGALVKGEYRGFYESKGKDGTVYLYGQMLQVDGQGKECLLEFRAKDETMFNRMTKGQQVEVVLNVREMNYQGRTFIVVDAV